MGTQASVPLAKSIRPAGPLTIRITFACYALLLLTAALVVPLRIPEILQIAAIRHLSPATFFTWIAQAPGSSPLAPLLQLPFVLLGGRSRFAARLLSLVFALAACYLFLRLAKRLALELRYSALLVFMLLPLHFELAFEALPLEQALFLVVLATDFFFRLISRPSIRNTLFYSGSLLLCLYTDRYSFLPAIGYLLFLLRFADRAGERRALWHALAATVVPVLLFLPYALWAHSQVSPDWFSGPPAVASPALYLRAVRSFATDRSTSYTLAALLAVGVVTGAFTSFRLDGGAIAKRIRLFVLAGGVCATIIIAVILDASAGERFSSPQLLWTAPATIILVFAALGWLARRPGLRSLAFLLTAVVSAVCGVADIQYLRSPSLPREDLQAIAAQIPQQLNGDSCVVFVSERFSRALFLFFEPELQQRECLSFFHRRIVLASHPYVRADQQHDAESFFRGLDFVETKRLSAGGGQIVIMQQHAK